MILKIHVHIPVDYNANNNNRLALVVYSLRVFCDVK
jgi:hypothetical protein